MLLTPITILSVHMLTVCVCVYTHIYNDPFVQQTLLLCRHDKVVGVVFVVNYVFQVNS